MSSSPYHIIYMYRCMYRIHSVSFGGECIYAPNITSTNQRHTDSNTQRSYNTGMKDSRMSKIILICNIGHRLPLAVVKNWSSWCLTADRTLFVRTGRASPALISGSGRHTVIRIRLNIVILLARGFGAIQHLLK